MKKRSRAGVVVITSICLSLGFGSWSYTRTHLSVPNPVQKGTAMAMHASGTFEVKLIPQPPEDKAEGSTLGRMSIDEQFHGELEGTGKGEMLTASTDTGSAVYVAIERVMGRLQGRSGTFVLVHHGTMTRDAPQLTITVVPDSGTGQLVGLAGTMAINIVDGLLIPQQRLHNRS